MSETPTPSLAEQLAGIDALVGEAIRLRIFDDGSGRAEAARAALLTAIRARLDADARAIAELRAALTESCDANEIAYTALRDATRDPMLDDSDMPDDIERWRTLAAGKPGGG